MRCSKCGFDNPADSEFCSHCGAALEVPVQPATSTAFCPQCGSPVSLEAQFCSHCGARLLNVCPKCGSEVTPGTRFCRQCGQDLSGGVIRQVARVAPGKRAFPLANIVAAGVGAVMMLVSLAVPWYAMRLQEGSANISASDLLSETGSDPAPSFAGSALPVVLVIIFASAVLLSVAYSLWRQRATKALWAWLGIISALCVIANAVYILWYIHDITSEFSDYGGQWVNIVHAGSILAFVGALVVAFSSIGGKRTK
jgi:ribosomal protein L40E